MDAIRKMIEEMADTRAKAMLIGPNEHLPFTLTLAAYLDCYAALGGDVSPWRGEDGRLL